MTGGSVRRFVDRVIFVPETSRNLAFVRIIVATHTLWMLLSRDLYSLSGLDQFWTFVPDSVRWRYLLFPGHISLELTLYILAVVCLVGAIIGAYPRLACGIAGLLVYHLAPLESIIWSTTPYARGLTIAPLALLILAFARSADAYTCLPQKPASNGNVPAWEYGWPTRLIWLLIAHMYFFSAYSKLAQTGLSWSSAENMRLWLLGLSFNGETLVLTPFTWWLADQSALLWIVGIGTVIFEWSFLLVLFSRRARRLLVPAAVLFHLGIAATMGIHVGETWLLAAFLNWDWLLSRLRAGGATLESRVAAS